MLFRWAILHLIKEIMCLNVLVCLLFVGIWQEIQNNKCMAADHAVKGTTISDITDGVVYRKLLPNESFTDGYNLTALLNTDGVSLFSSSKIELWPLYFVINELSPSTRFARENILLAGAWQGKGKPPFVEYLSCFSNAMNVLSEKGINVTVDNIQRNVKLAILCCTADLPAKAGILNMTLFNGSQACRTCEETGIVVNQGKGHSRCYPFRSIENKFKLHTDTEVRQCMENATKRNRLIGFKGLSGLYTLNCMNFVEGMVPDYMHGILLGIVKVLFSKWFSPTSATQPYFIGTKLPLISKVLKQIKPAYFIERLPRDLEKHYHNFKATELQNWLLFYWLPCFEGILPAEYFEHFANLSEAVYILLGDNIANEALAKAEILLTTFYSHFEHLYGRGSCGINIHNTGEHLVWYVKLWGPLWAWSCFPFEDNNAVVLKSVHGTGNVVKQLLQQRDVQAMLRTYNISHKSKQVKKQHECANCLYIGQLLTLPSEVASKLEGFHEVKLFMVTQIIVNEKRFFFAYYSRMSSRICNVVLLCNGDIVRIVAFMLDTSVNEMYAYVELMAQYQIKTVSHIRKVRASGKFSTISVENLAEVLLFMSICETAGSGYVSTMPNTVGRAIFK